MLKKVATGDPAGNSVTADRLRALITLAPFARSRPSNVSYGLKTILRHFEEIERSTALLEVAEALLTADEEETLRDFA